MPRLSYVGPEPADPTDLVSRGQGQAIINAAPINRSDISAMVETATTTKAAKSYIDLADAGFATADYYRTRDELNVAVTDVGAPGGVAALVSGVIPLAQIPVLGSGLVKGPFGPTAITPQSSITTPAAKIAEWVIGIQSVAFQPLGYALVAVDTTPGARPILEMRLNNVLIADGKGRALHNGRQIVAVTPASETLGAANPSPWPLGTAITVTLHVSSATSVPVSVGSASVLSGAVYLVKMAA